MAFVEGVVVAAIAIWASTLLPGVDVHAESTAGMVATLLLVAVIFVLVHTALRPYLRVLAHPLYVATNGLFALVANALLFWLTGRLADLVHLPFHIAGFWAALWGALIVSVVAVQVERSLTI